MKQTQAQDTALKVLAQFPTLSEVELKDTIGGDGRTRLSTRGIFGKK